MSLINKFKEMLAEKEFHADVREGKIYLYYWIVDSRGKDHMTHQIFHDWNEVWDFVKNKS